jgi:hypothetical protein
VVVVLGVAAIAHWKSPTQLRADEPQFVDALIATQIDRAGTIDAPEVLILGDSSALMNIDPILLGHLLGRRVETLATVAYAGPRGMAALLDRLANRGLRPGLILLTMHSAGLARKPEWSTWTERVVRGPPDRQVETNLLRGALGKLNDLVSTTIYRPLEGAYGSYYGGLMDFERFVRLHHGGAVDPRPRSRDGDTPVKALEWCCSFEISEHFRAELPALRTALGRHPGVPVRLLVSPLPKRWATPLGRANRSSATNEILAGLGLDLSALIDSPEYLPGADFAAPTHLHESAVPVFTRLLGQKLDESVRHFKRPVTLLREAKGTD